jgi:UPF0755 protein
VSIDNPNLDIEAATATGPRHRHVRFERRPLRWIILGIMTLVVMVIGYYELENHAIIASGSGSSIITVTSGEPASQVFGDMANKNIVGSAIMMRLYVTIHGTPTILPGSYQMPQASTFGAASALLNAGPNIIPLEVPAGFTFKAIVNRMAAFGATKVADEMVAAEQSGAVRSPFEPASMNNLEGLLAPGEYLIKPSDSGASVLQIMVNRFVALAGSQGLTPSTTLNGLDAYDLVKATSIVEKEGYFAINMPKVARVIYNRLAKSMPLQMDSTILYALGRDGGTVTSADLAIHSPYNTYLNAGLPPTPTCMASGNAIRSVMNAPAGGWLYFVVINRAGVEAFSNTYAEQLANEAIARAAGL